MAQSRVRCLARALTCALLLGTLALGAQNANDQTIVSDINAKLFADSVLKTRDIRVSSNGGVVKLEGSVRTRLEKSAVDRIASTEPGVTQVVDSLAITETSSDEGAATPSAPPKPAGLTVPAGTVVTVRMIDSIDSSRDQPGREFDATVDNPVVAGDRVAIPKGATAKVRLVNASTSGRIQGSAQLQLELVSITANGATYNVESGYYQQHGASRGKRTGEAAGGGAVLGGLIGAIAGGGKGAAIGAGSGAAIGTGASAAGKRQAIRVPSETKIDFTLKEPVIVNAGA